MGSSGEYTTLDGETYVTAERLAQTLGVTLRTIRAWERQGYLRHRANIDGQRVYAPGDVHPSCREEG